MTRGLSILIGDKRAGDLWLDERKRFCFRYEESWLKESVIPLSLSLPLRAAPYVDDEPHAFFANLLPEQKIREVIARNLGISPGNDFALLEKIGGDCAGAVSVLPGDEHPAPRAGGYQRINDAELAEIIRSLPRKPLLAGEEGMRLSLAGAQKKLPVRYRNGEFFLCLDGAASSHIIKPPIEGLDGTVENEAFCMRLAASLGLDVPRSFLCAPEGLKLFVIERYDRVISDERVERLHQEDFCQAMNILPEFKYEAEGGPSLARCFELVRKRSARPGRDVLSLLRWVAFNYLIGNGDGHGKNLSLLLLPDGPVLTPFYDLLSTQIYAHFGVAGSLAMSIAGEAVPSAVQRRHWERFAEEMKIKPSLVLREVLDLAKAIHGRSLDLFRGEFQAHRCDALHRLVELIHDRAERTVKRVG